MAFGVASETGLKRINEEKTLLRNISALEKSLAEETDPERKFELIQQLTSLKEVLSFSSRDSSEKPKQQKLTIETPSSAELKFYRIIIEKYSSLINEQSNKTVGQIKALITKDDLTIQNLASNFKIDSYKFENHYMQAAEKAYNYIVENIDFVDADISISFWLSPKEIVENKIGDDEDQSVFLCSLLYSLGDENAEVVVAELEKGFLHAFVMTNYREKFILLDPAQKKPFRSFIGERKEILEKYSFKNSKIKRFLYRFNQSKYEQFD